MPTGYPNNFITYPFSGIQNNFVVWPWHISDAYDEISGIEKIIGLNPLNGYSSLTARITGIENIIQITAPNPSTNNAIVTYSGTTGAGLRNNQITIDPNSNFAFAGNIMNGTSGFAAGNNNYIGNHYAFAGGEGNTSSGTWATAFGLGNQALGTASFAEGCDTQALGTFSHSEGASTSAIGDYSHAEGSSTVAFGGSSHSEGINTYASGDYSHAQNFQTKALGFASTSIGNGTIAFGAESFAAGISSVASGFASTSIGAGSANHDYSMVLTDSTPTQSSQTNELTLRFANGVRLSNGTSLLNGVSGINNVGSPINPFSGVYADNIFIHGVSLGTSSVSSASNLGAGTGIYSSLVGGALQFKSLITGVGINIISDANTITISSTATGGGGGSYLPLTGGALTGGLNVDFLNSNLTSAVTISGNIQQGMGNQTFGTNGFAGGNASRTFSSGSFAYGNNVIATGSFSHAEGSNTQAIGNNSHAEGNSTQTWGANSHSQGNLSIASGNTSFAAGTSASALHDYSTVLCDSNGATSTATNQLTLGFVNGISLTSGTNITPVVSGINNIGTSASPFNNTYSNYYWANTPTYAQIAVSGNSTTQVNNTNLQVVSGTYSLIGSSSNFSTTLNPMKITYTGTQSFIGRVFCYFAFSALSTDQNFYILKNGSIIPNIGMELEFQTAANPNRKAGSLEYMGQINTNDYFQIGIEKIQYGIAIIQDAGLTISKLM